MFTLYRIFATESFTHLRLVFQEYHKLTGQDIESAIKREMSTSVQRAFLAVGKCYSREKNSNNNFEFLFLLKSSNCKKSTNLLVK
jgi:hypothetical protein